MNISTSTLDLGSVNLTAVPATHHVFAARGINWNEQAEVHRAVMSLFAAELPGAEGAKRSASSILYRLEIPTSGPRVLVQSSATPIYSDSGIATTTLAGLASVLVPGLTVRLRVDVNAVRSQSRTRKRVPVGSEALSEFFLNPGDIDRPGLLHGALESLTIFDVTQVVRAAGGIPLRVAQISGEAVVADPEQLADKLINGVGRGKSYGCGLLTVAPA